MKNLQDIRYKADGATTAAAQTIILPIWLSVERPTHHSAVRQARNLVEQLTAELPQFTAKGATLQMGNPAHPGIQDNSELVLVQASRDSVRVQLDFFLVLTLQTGPFWEHAELIAQAIDFGQQFCAKPRDKHTIVQMEAARFPNETARPVVDASPP